MKVKLLAAHYLEFLSLKEGCTGLSESTLVKMLHCWKLHVTAQMYKPMDIKPEDHNVQSGQHALRYKNLDILETRFYYVMIYLSSPFGQ